MQNSFLLSCKRKTFFLQPSEYIDHIEKQQQRKCQKNNVIDSSPSGHSCSKKAGCKHGGKKTIGIGQNKQRTAPGKSFAGARCAFPRKRSKQRCINQIGPAEPFLCKKVCTVIKGKKNRADYSRPVQHFFLPYTVSGSRHIHYKRQSKKQKRNQKNQIFFSPFFPDQKTCQRYKNNSHPEGADIISPSHKHCCQRSQQQRTCFFLLLQH